MRLDESTFAVIGDGKSDKGEGWTIVPWAVGIWSWYWFWVLLDFDFYSSNLQLLRRFRNLNDWTVILDFEQSSLLPVSILNRNFCIRMNDHMLDIMNSRIQKWIRELRSISILCTNLSSLLDIHILYLISYCYFTNYSYDFD